MTWAERKQILEQMLDRAIEEQQNKVMGAPTKEEVIVIAGLVEGVKDCRYEAEREHDARQFYDVRRELQDIVDDMPDTIVLATGTPMAPQVSQIMMAGQRIKQLVADLERMDL